MRPSERQVHLFNKTDVRDLIRLLNKEVRMIEARERGEWAKRPSGIKRDRPKRIALWELKMLKIHQAILEEFEPEPVEGEAGFPKSLLQHKVTVALEYSTPVEIGPRYTTGLFTKAIERNIRLRFRAETFHGIAACIEWVEGQIEGLETSPLHYSGTAKKTLPESRFLEGVRRFRKELKLEQEHIGPPPPPPPMPPTAEVEAIGKKPVPETDSSKVKSVQPSMKPSVDSTSSTPTGKSEVPVQSGDSGGQCGGDERNADEKDAADDDSDGWATSHINYSPEPNGSGPRTSSPSPSSSPSPAGSEQEREYTPFSPLSPEY